MIEATLPIKHDPAVNSITVYFGHNYPEAVKKFVEKSNRLHSGYARVRLLHPGRPRSTGEKSQNHRLNGFIQQICVETGNDFDQVKMEIKFRAINRGYPFQTLSTGDRLPKSESESTVEECSLLIQEVEQLAAELNIRLKEK
jgi:hypothetical protein